MKLLSSFIFLDTTSTHYLTFGNIFMGASIVCCLGEPEISLGTVFYHAPGGGRISFKTMVSEDQDRVPQTNPEPILYQSDITLMSD